MFGATLFGANSACARGHPNAGGASTASLRWLSATYIQTQKLRISVENRAWAAAQSRSPEPAPRALADLSAQLLGEIGDIALFATVAKLWRFAGQAVVRRPCGACLGRPQPHPCPRCAGRSWIGRRETRIRGVPSPYNARLKTTLYQVAMALLRCGSPYRAVYDRARAAYVAREMTMPAAARWSTAHCHQAALRRMIKAFLTQLFVAWRTAEGLDVPGRRAHRPALFER